MNIFMNTALEVVKIWHEKERQHDKPEPGKGFMQGGAWKMKPVSGKFYMEMRLKNRMPAPLLMGAVSASGNPQEGSAPVPSLPEIPKHGRWPSWAMGLRYATGGNPDLVKNRHEEKRLL